MGWMNTIVQCAMQNVLVAAGKVALMLEVLYVQALLQSPCMVHLLNECSRSPSGCGLGRS